MAILIADRKEEQTMHSSLFIANRFIDLATQNGRQLTHMQVQKLVYFAHALALVTLNNPLIRESFQAYPFGPVETTLYEALRGYGARPITTQILIQQEEHPLEANEDYIIRQIYDQYAGFDAYQLSDMTHVPGGPWESAWNMAHFSIIPNDYIRRFYSQEA